MVIHRVWQDTIEFIGSRGLCSSIADFASRHDAKLTRFTSKVFL